ncbi:MAG: segregation/condensation protein A [Planctomycetes bacterium]|nr:segregation/condensation protein A [Planctomycetota bacterium]
MTFRVDSKIFRGPLDLLLYLVRKQEVDVTELSLAGIARQYQEYLEVLQILDIDAVGDFLEMTSTLVELKSRLVLPHGGEEVDALTDPAYDLVDRLLEYKRFRDAASMLDEQSRNWQQHYPRLVDRLPARDIDRSTQPIREVELWDLVSAFGRIIRESQAIRSANIVYDETPLRVYMERIHKRLAEQGSVSFSEFFAPGMHKSAMIGVFLAILELVRHHSVVTDQPNLHGEIWVHPGTEFEPSFDGADVQSVFESVDSEEAQSTVDDSPQRGTSDRQPTTEPRYKPK